VDLWGGEALVAFPTYESSIQRHLCALWEDEVIKETGRAGCLVEYELL